jgi:hypothetical protein
MIRVIARLTGEVCVVSVVDDDEGATRHYYRVYGGPDDGLEFATLAAVCDYALALVTS